MQAVDAAFACNPLIVGSVKSNIGHCEAASALIGLIKTVLCLENVQIPAQMHFDTPNPAVDLTHRTIPTKNLGWPGTDGSARRAAINTFGAGGTNGHAVLEAYHAPSSDQKPAKRPWLFKVSAADKISLEALCQEYARFIKAQKPNLRDLAHTLLGHRSSLRYTRFLVASNQDELVARLRHDNSPVVATSSGKAGKVLVVFTGQGAQW